MCPMQIVEQYPDAGFYSTFRGTRTAMTLAAGEERLPYRPVALQGFRIIVGWY